MFGIPIHKLIIHFHRIGRHGGHHDSWALYAKTGTAPHHADHPSGRQSAHSPRPHGLQLAEMIRLDKGSDGSCGLRHRNDDR
jgi:hypothetical protein